MPRDRNLMRCVCAFSFAGKPGEPDRIVRHGDILTADDDAVRRAPQYFTRTDLTSAELERATRTAMLGGAA